MLQFHQFLLPKNWGKTKTSAQIIPKMYVYCPIAFFCLCFSFRHTTFHQREGDWRQLNYLILSIFGSYEPELSRVVQFIAFLQILYSKC